MAVVHLTDEQRKAVAALTPLVVARELCELDPRLKREMARLRAAAESVVRTPDAVISSRDLEPWCGSQKSRQSLIQ